MRPLSSNKKTLFRLLFGFYLRLSLTRRKQGIQTQAHLRPTVLCLLLQKGTLRRLTLVVWFRAFYWPCRRIMLRTPLDRLIRPILRSSRRTLHGL